MSGADCKLWTSDLWVRPRGSSRIRKMRRRQFQSGLHLNRFIPETCPLFWEQGDYVTYAKKRRKSLEIKLKRLSAIYIYPSICMPRRGNESSQMYLHPIWNRLTGFLSAAGGWIARRQGPQWKRIGMDHFEFSQLAKLSRLCALSTATSIGSSQHRGGRWRELPNKNTLQNQMGSEQFSNIKGSKGCWAQWRVHP